MRGADLDFASGIRRSALAHSRSTQLVVAEKHAPRLQAALGEMGVGVATGRPAAKLGFGRELVSRFQHVGGLSRTWYVERLPGSEIEPGWLFRLLPPGLAISLAWFAVPLPAAWIVHYLQRQLVSMRATRLLDGPAGISDPSIAGALPNAEDLQRRLASSQDKAFHVSVYLTLTSSTLADLEIGSRRIESAARAILCDLQPCTFRMLDGFVATQAGGADRLQRKRVIDSTALVTFFPGGIQTCRNLQASSWVAARPPAPRCSWIRSTSVATPTPTSASSATRAPARPTSCRHSQWAPWVEASRSTSWIPSTSTEPSPGSWAAWTSSSPSAPATPSTSSTSGRPIATTKPGSVPRRRTRSISAPAYAVGWTSPSVRLSTALFASPTKRSHSQCCVHVAERLPQQSRVAVILHRWVHGSLGEMFSAPTNVDLEAPIVAFGMRELRDEMVAPVHFLLAEALWTRIKRRDRRRILVIDELGLLFEDPTIRRFVVSLARRIPKYDGSLVFATQNPGDLLSSDQGSVVATNPALLFLGAQRPGEAAKLQDVFHLSAHQRGALEAAHRGEFLLAAGADRLAIQVQAPAWQEEVMRLARTTARPPP